MQKRKKKEKTNNKLWVTTLVSEISCVEDHAKLPHLVIVAVVGFIYFSWRKMKACRPLGGRRYGEMKFEWTQLVNYYSRKPSFTLKINQDPFLRTPDGYDGRSFRRRGGEKKHFFVNFQRSEFRCFWSVNRESVKELTYQKKNGGHQESKRVTLLAILF